MTPAEWTIKVEDQDHNVTLTPTPNGKMIVRVDGRTVAKPISPEESERIVPVGNALYVVTRDEDGEFFLFQHEVLRPAPSGGPAARLPHRIAEMPLNLKSSSPIRPVAVAWLVIVVLAGLTLFYAVGPNYEKQAVGRVEQILGDMAQGTGAEVQFAVGLWFRNVKTLSDRDELSWASDHFDRWRMEKNLYRTFGSWRVIDSELVEDSVVPTARVTVEIEGARYAMLVPERDEITWTNVE